MYYYLLPTLDVLLPSIYRPVFLLRILLRIIMMYIVQYLLPMYM